MKPEYNGRVDADARGAGRSSGRSERGSRSSAGRNGRPPARMTSTTAHVGDGVPILLYGPENNFSKFKEKLARAAIEKFGDLGRLIETAEYFKPPQPDIESYDLANDPHGVNVADYREARKERRRKLTQMEDDKPKLYAMILGRLSVESIDELKRHQAYDKFNRTKDPLMLWLAITLLHQVASVSKVASVVKKAARDNYGSMRQGQFETIIPFKERFDAAVAWIRARFRFSVALLVFDMCWHQFRVSGPALCVYVPRLAT